MVAQFVFLFLARPIFQETLNNRNGRPNCQCYCKNKLRAWSALLWTIEMRSKFWFYFAVKLLAIIVISMVGKSTDHGKLLSIL